MKLKKGFAIAQAAMLMLTLVVMSFPVSARAEEDNQNQQPQQDIQQQNQNNQEDNDDDDQDSDGEDHQNEGHNGTLIVHKVIVGNPDASPSSFSFTVKKHHSQSTVSSSAFDVSGQNSMSVHAGHYDVTETPADHYTTSYDNCSNVNVHKNQTATCTITNTYVPPVSDACLNIDGIQETVPQGYTANNDHICTKIPPTNSCVAPSTLEQSGQRDIGNSPDGANSQTQDIMNAAGYSVTVGTDQTNDQAWNGSGNTVHLSAKYLAGHTSNGSTPSTAGDKHVFGYMLNGGAFVAVFKDYADDGDAYDGVQVAGTKAFDLASVSDVVFAVKDVSNGKTYATKSSLNDSGTQHAVVYNPSSNTYAIGFEDQNLGDHDYNDLVVEVKVTGCENPNQITVVATKIVCDKESDIPNNMTSSHATDANTANDWINGNVQKEIPAHPSCHLARDWQFEWGNQSATDAGRDFVGTSTGYTTSGVTGADGTVSISIPLAGVTEVHMREVLKNGYIPFTYDTAHPSDTDNVSAVLSCDVDGLHYDNFDFIRNPVAGNTYYCVAWNAPKAPECNADATTTLLSGDIGENELITLAVGHGPAKLVAPPFPGTWFVPALGDGKWIWKDTFTSDADALTPVPETFERNFKILGTPLDATLTIAADNSYDVKVNGHQECFNSGEHNYEATVNCTIPAADMISGWNTLDITVTNLVNGQGGAANPAGLSYKLVTHDNQCSVPENPTNGTIVIEKDTTGGDGSFDFDIAGEQGYDADVTTVNGQGTTTVSVAPGNYNLTETGVTGWNLDSVSCQYDEQDVGNQIPNGEAITIAAGHTVTCTFHNTKTTDSTPTSTNGTTGSGGGKKHSNGGGEVLGASTCSPLLTDYLKLGWKNNADQVSKLQQFLNDQLGLSLPISGFFGQMTFNAVKQFQKQYGNDVLHPWVGLPGSGISGNDTPTGFVYQTTRWKINNIFCPGSEAFPTVLN